MMKRPRQHNESHLNFVRGLPCLVCLNNIETEAAHLRFGDHRAAKRQTGMQEKPSDCWTVPLCGRCHRDQHAMGEHKFWFDRGIDPIFVAATLFCNSGDAEAGERIVSAARNR